MPTGPQIDSIDLREVCEVYEPDRIQVQERFTTTSGAPKVIRAADKKRWFRIEVGPYDETEGDAFITAVEQSTFTFYPKGETTGLTCIKVSEGVQMREIRGGFTQMYSCEIMEA